MKGRKEEIIICPEVAVCHLTKALPSQRSLAPSPMNALVDGKLRTPIRPLSGLSLFRRGFYWTRRSEFAQLGRRFGWKFPAGRSPVCSSARTVDVGRVRVRLRTKWTSQGQQIERHINLTTARVLYTHAVLIAQYIFDGQGVR